MTEKDDDEYSITFRYSIYSLDDALNFAYLCDPRLKIRKWINDDLTKIQIWEIAQEKYR